MTGSAVATQNAIRDLILAISPSIVPKTTLTVAANSGDIALTVADSSHFVPGGFVFFNDTLGEPMQTVSNATGTSITLDYTGVTPTSLTYTHTNGTTVYTNLMTEVPTTIGPMLALGDPFIFVMTLDETEYRKFFGAGNSLKAYQMRVQYHRSLIRPDDSLMDPNRWAYQQQEQARADLDTISATLRSNERFNQTATMLGVAGKSDKLMSRSWRKIVADRDSQTIVAAIDLTVTGSTI